MNPAVELARWLPGVQVWYGCHTGSWWAYLPGRPGRLVEAPDPQHLARKLATRACSRHPRPGIFGDDNVVQEAQADRFGRVT